MYLKAVVTYVICHAFDTWNSFSFIKSNNVPCLFLSFSSLIGVTSSQGKVDTVLSLESQNTTFIPAVSSEEPQACHWASLSPAFLTWERGNDGRVGILFFLSGGNHFQFICKINLKVESFSFYLWYIGLVLSLVYRTCTLVWMTFTVWMISIYKDRKLGWIYACCCC